MQTNHFRENTKIKSVNFPESLMSIGSSAFRGCTGITQITLNDNLEKIGFEKTHNPTTETAIGEVSTVRLKHPDGGYHVDISDIASVPTDLTYIRMNVDDFDAAYAILEKHVAQLGHSVWNI